MMFPVLVLQGPNLNMLGKREQDIYGKYSLKEIDERLQNKGMDLGLKVTCRQSNHEGDLIDWLHEADSQFEAIIFNPGAFTHYSYALRDAIASIKVPVIEVHISHLPSREAFRKQSVIAPVCKGQIVGFGVLSYELALVAIKERVVK